MMTLLKSLDRLVFLICKWGVILGLAALFLLLGANVLTRTIPFITLAGYDEIVELLFAWMTFLGAVALWREGGLYKVAVVAQSAPRPLRRVIDLLIRALMLILALAMAVKGAEFVRYSGETTPFLRLDKAYWYAAVPTAGALMTVYSVVALVRFALGHDLEKETVTDNLS
ncbi:TRAP transporter small permease [Pikeienuella sp. HZG-20]|uniref:TRAP transporter small permease n=1 Tax=Paludibacillus litoralis TaxID=3133267 RepID=UPI0030EB95F5